MNADNIIHTSFAFVDPNSLTSLDQSQAEYRPHEDRLKLLADGVAKEVEKHYRFFISFLDNMQMPRLKLPKVVLCKK